jgi:hypothetical protein
MTPREFLPFAPFLGRLFLQFLVELVQRDDRIELPVMNVSLELFCVGRGQAHDFAVAIAKPDVIDTEEGAALVADRLSCRDDHDYCPALAHRRNAKDRQTGGEYHDQSLLAVGGDAARCSRLLEFIEFQACGETTHGPQVQPAEGVEQLLHFRRVRIGTVAGAAAEARGRSESEGRQYPPHMVFVRAHRRHLTPF